MYIIKNAFRCIGRSKGRNALMGIIVLVIAVSACIGLSIRQAAVSAKEETLSGMKVTATISFDRQSMMGNMMGEGGGGQPFDREQFSEIMGNTSSLTLEDYQKYAAADSVKDFYYTLSVSFDGTDDFEAVTTDTAENTETNETQQNPMNGFGGGFGGGRFEFKGMNSGDFNITGYGSDTAMTAFINGTAKISEGKVFAEGTESYDCIISEELATYNNTVVGDKITLVNPNSEEETYELTVVGIYTDESANESFQMMPNSDPANEIYMSYMALNAIVEASGEASQTVIDEDSGREYETKLNGNLNATYVFADVDAYNSFEEQARKLGLDEGYSISSQDANNFENSLVPLNTLSTMAGWFLIVILIIGAVILVVMNIFNIRERKYEIGVLMAIGMKKINISMQFLTEIFAVTIAAVIIGVGIGAISAVPVTNELLKNQIASSESEAEEIEQGFGRGEMPDMGNMGGFSAGGRWEMQKPPSGGSFGMENIFGKQAANYISEINSAMNLTVVMQMLSIAILLTIVAGAASILFVMRYEPLKILANRD